MIKEVIIMLRKFLQCSHAQQRLEMMMNSSAESWSSSELDTVLRMLNTETAESSDNETKYRKAIEILKSRLETGDADQTYMKNLNRMVENLEKEAAAEEKAKLETYAEDQYRRVFMSIMAMRQMAC